MTFTIPKAVYTGKIKEVVLGKGARAVTVGGETSYPFHLFEGEMPHAPRIAIEVYDVAPDDWAAAALSPYLDVINDPVAWARKAVDVYGAELIALQLVSTDPNGLNKSSEEATETAKKVAAALRYARSQAVSRSQPYSVIFDRDNNRVVIRGIPQPLTPDQTEAAEEEPGMEAESAAEAAKKKPEIKVVSLPEGITLTEITVGGKEITATKEELAQMVFYSDGTSQGGELVLADSRDRKFRVRVAFLTGVVTLEEQES